MYPSDLTQSPCEVKGQKYFIRKSSKPLNTFRLGLVMLFFILPGFAAGQMFPDEISYGNYNI